MVTRWMKEHFKDAERAKATISVASGAFSLLAFLVVLTAYLFA